MKNDNQKPDVDHNHLAIYFASRIFDLLEAIVRFGCIPLFFWLTVRELAGQETVVDVVVNYLAKGPNIFPWTLAGATTLWATRERSLRHRKVAHMSEHLKNVEKRIDEKRTSSGLTSSGQTPRRGGKENK